MRTQPNIIFILLDDMGWRDLNCCGSTFYETPNIDRLCREGMRFDSGYAACPVCSPSRASYMTGCYPVRTEVTDWIDMSGTFHPLKGKLIEAPYKKHLSKDQVLLPQALKEGGYSTWHVGKWHLGRKEYYPDQMGYDVNVAGCDWGHPHGGYFSPYHIETLKEGPEGEYLTDRLTDEALQLIQNQPQDKPFFLSLCEYTVHTPIQAKEKDIEKFRQKAKRLGLDKVEAIVEGETLHTENAKDVHVMRRTLQSDVTYAAMIWNLDENIGKLMDCLQKTGRMDNTVIFFTSDNGGLSTAEGSPTCNFPAIEGKGWMYEGGTRVPTFAWGKNYVKSNAQCDTPITTPDYYPTLLTLAGLPLRNEQHKDGVDLTPLLKGEKIAERPIFWHYPHYGNQGGTPGSSVRLGDYKLIEFFEDDKLELYNLKDDLSEQCDLSETHKEKVAELHALLKAWRKETGALIPQKNDNWA